jgi:hypothetical protein
MRRRDHCLALVLLVTAACDAGTGGRPVTFDLRLTADTGGAGGVRTSTGWQVELEEACVALGPVYVWSGAGHLQGRQWFRWPRLVRVAHARSVGDHFDGGDVRGEWVAQAVFRPLAAGGMSVDAVSGLEGPVASFTVLLDPPRGALADDPCLRGHHAYAVGVARKGDAVVPFEGGLHIENVGTSRRVDGVALDGRLAQGAKLTITLNVSAWFDGAQWDRLTTRNAAGRFVIDPASQVRAAWFIGARGVRTFSGTIEAAD